MRKATILGVGLAQGLVINAYSQGLEEILVTATRRQESLQDVPVSVAAVGRETIEYMGVVDLEEVSLYIPNFQASISTILPNLYVRGLGTGTSHSIEQPVGRFVDDVYIGRGAASMLSFLDVQAVEVLRGPQGTLFGKNTMAGAMIVRTADPTDAFESQISMGWGSYSTNGHFAEYEGFVSGALGRSTRGRVALRVADSDGYVLNRLRGPNGGSRDEFGIRMKLDHDVGQRTTLQFKLEHGEFQAEGNTSMEIIAPPESNPGMANAFRFFSPGWDGNLDWVADYACADDPPVVHSLPGFCPDRDQDVQASVLRVSHDRDAGQFLSITAFQQYEFLDRFYAIDMGIAGGAYSALRDEDYDSFTQEFRFTSNSQRSSDYIVGLYVEDSNLSRYSNTDIDFTRFPGLPLQVQQNEVFDQDTETLALFGQYRHRINTRLRLLLGARFTDEEKTFEFNRFYEPFATPYDPNNRVPFPPGPFGPLDAAIDRPAEVRSESRFTPSIGVEYDVSEALLIYGTLAQGHKAGGFSDRVSRDPAASIQFEEEVNNAIEFGMKGQYLGGTLQYNVAAFHMQIDDLQVSSAIPGTVAFQVQNAAEAVSQGVEMDGRWAVGDNWLLGGNLAYTDAYYDRFPNADCTPSQAAIAGPGCTQDLGDRTLIFAPEWKSTLYAQYETTLPGGWGLMARADFTYSDDYYTDTMLSGGVFQESYSIYNAAIWFTSQSDRISLGLIGRNLTEEAYRTFGLSSPGSSVYLAEANLPRRYMLKLQARF